MRRVQLGDIKIGSPLPWTVYDDKGAMLLCKGYVPTSRSQLDTLIRRGLFIDTDGERKKAPDPIRESELPVYQRVQSYLEDVGRIHKNLLTGSGTELPRRIREVAAKFRKLCGEATDTVLAALHLGESDYGLSHATHVAVLADTLAAAKDFSDPERDVLFCASLTHDVGILHIQEMLDRTPELNDKQWQEVRRHPSRSVALLRNAGVDDELWLELVRAHHERPDGSGYERGIQGEKIPMLARILSVCDIYSAMIRPRPYRDAVLAKDALRDIFLSRGRSVDDELAQLFIKELGIFPPGGLVRLKNGEIAVIVQRGADRMKPLVRSVIGARGMPLTRCLDRNTAEQEYAIVEMVSLREYPWVVKNLHAVCTT